MLNLCQRERNNRRGQWQSFYETTQLHSWLASVAIINLLNSTWQIFPILDFKFAKKKILLTRKSTFTCILEREIGWRPLDKTKEDSKEEFAHLQPFQPKNRLLSPSASKGHPVLLLHFLLLDVKLTSNCDAVTERWFLKAVFLSLLYKKTQL